MSKKELNLIIDNQGMVIPNKTDKKSVSIIADKYLNSMPEEIKKAIEEKIERKIITKITNNIRVTEEGWVYHKEYETKDIPFKWTARLVTIKE